MKRYLDIRTKEELHLESHPTAERVVRVARERWGPLFCNPDPHFTRFFLAYVRRGEGKCLREDGEWLPLRQGMLFCQIPGHLRDVRVKGDSLELYIFLTEAGPLSRLAAELFGPMSFAVAVPESAGVDLLCEQILREARNGGENAAGICGAYLNVLLWKAADARAGIDVAMSQAERTFHQCRRYMERNYSSLRSTAEVAAGCHVHSVHLCRLFRRFAEETPLRYLTRLRMRRAAHLLENSPYSVQEVAVEVGMDDPFVFSKTFKRVMGVSPKKYRERAVSTRKTDHGQA